jgi:hypothetical protein
MKEPKESWIYVLAVFCVFTVALLGIGTYTAINILKLLTELL